MIDLFSEKQNIGYKQDTILNFFNIFSVFPITHFEIGWFYVYIYIY